MFQQHGISSSGSGAARDPPRDSRHNIVGDVHRSKLRWTSCIGSQARCDRRPGLRVFGEIIRIITDSDLVLYNFSGPKKKGIPEFY